jgi:hypothetical protein
MLHVAEKRTFESLARGRSHLTRILVGTNAMVTDRNGDCTNFVTEKVAANGRK